MRRINIANLEARMTSWGLTYVRMPFRTNFATLENKTASSTPLQLISTWLSNRNRIISLCVVSCLVFGVLLLQRSYTRTRAFFLPSSRTLASSYPLQFSSPVPVTAGSMPRGACAVAVVFAGSLRTFSNEYMRNTIIANVHDTLRISGYSVHTFFHVDKPEELTARLLHPFQPVTVTRFHNLACPPKAPGCENVLGPRFRHPWVLCRAHEAWNVVLAAEYASGHKFEWIYRLRPDIAYLRPLPVPMALDVGVVHVNQHLPNRSEFTFPYIRKMLADDRGLLLRERMGDHVVIVPRSFADVLFSAADSYKNCPLRAIETGMCPEIGLAYWFARYSVPVQVHQWFWVIVREIWGPECIRVQGLGKDKHEIQSRIEECERLITQWGYTARRK